MSLVPSPSGAPFPPPPLVLFNSFLSQNSPAKDGEKQSELSDGSSPMDSEVSVEKVEDGAVSATQPPQQQHPVDFPALAMHLLQQAHLGMFGGGGGGSNQNGGKPFPPSFSCLPASVPSPPATLPASSTSKRSSPSHPKSGSSSSASSSGSSSGSRRSGSGRSGSGAPPPPAISAALLAPSPLGALPAIPGALAVAASPAAQLFRDDDWSWHRNPAAAIRSGGTNKQTPVWKYFVYNKTENLSRCIVGTCTYQLKGPHTSTLACHLKKHAAEYAEFQRLKAEYTRERVISGQQSAAGDPNPNMASLGGSSSSCSTPSSQSNGGGGVLTVRENPTKFEETRRSPQEGGRTNIMGPNHHHHHPFSSCTPSPGPGFGRSDNGMVEQHPTEYHHPPQLNNHFQQFAPPATLSHHHPLNGSIFGPLHPHHPLNGFCSPHPSPAPPQFHHLMMAAAMAAANGNATPGSGAPQPPEKVAELFPEGAGRRAEEGKVPKGRKREKPSTGSGGTGANLLDILNLLSKRAAAAAAEKEEREQEEEVEEEDEMKRMMGRRKKKERKMMKMEDEEEDEEVEGRAHRLTHSVEHLLLKEKEEGVEGGMKKAKMEKTDEEEEQQKMDGRMDNNEKDEKGEKHLEDDKWVPDEKAEEDDDEVMGKKNRVEDEEEDDHPPLGLRDTLALCLATSFSRPALRHLLEDNPFFRHFRFPSSAGGGEEGLTLEQVEEVLSSQWALLRRQLGARLARGPFGLLALVRCAHCRLPRAQCPCPSSSLFCSITALIPGAKCDDTPSPPILLAQRPFQGGDQTDRQMESLVEQVLVEFSPSGTVPLRPCFILVHPPTTSSSSGFSIPSLPAFLSRSLQNSVRKMLREDAEQKRMRSKFWRMSKAMNLAKFDAGLAMPSRDLILADGDDDDIDAFFKFGPPILEKHTELAQIWEEKMESEQPVEPKMDVWEWQSLRESVRLFEFCKSFEQQMTGETGKEIIGHWEHTLGTIRESFPSLGELTQSVAADLANKTGALAEMAKHAMDGEWEPTMFTRLVAGGGNEDEGEGDAEWAEQSTLLLANWRPTMS